MSDDKPIQEQDTAPETPSRKVSEEVKKLSRSEKVRNYLIGLGAASALILGLIQQFKGEPVAEKTWETLRRASNEQAVALNKLKARLVYFQALQEARTSVEIQHKLDTLQEKYDALLAKQSVSADPPSTEPDKQPKKDCREGSVRGEDERCHRVRKTVAEKVKKDEKRVELARKALEDEKRKRLEAERRKKTLMKKLQQVEQAPPMPAKKIRLLPKSLNRASETKDKTGLGEFEL